MNLKAQRFETAAGKKISPVSHTSLSDEIVEQVIDLISRDILKPGERLPSEKELCLRFGSGAPRSAKLCVLWPSWGFSTAG